MERITILNRCHCFRGLVYQQAHFSADKKSIEVAVRPRKGSVAICSRCRLPAPGYVPWGDERQPGRVRRLNRLRHQLLEKSCAGTGAILSTIAPASGMTA
jgi:hypothetical protein